MIRMTILRDRYHNIRATILPPLVIAIVLLQTLFIFVVWRHQHKERAAIAETTVQRVRDLLQEEMKRDIAKMSTAMEVIVRDAKLIDALTAADRIALIEQAQPLFEQFRDKHQITHFYFHQPNRINFLRLHKKRKGDLIDRVTIQTAEQTGRSSAGLEQGPTGNPVLRLVYPWRSDFAEKSTADLFANTNTGKLIGYLELGIEFEDIARRIRNILDVELILAVDKIYLDRQRWANRNKKLGRQSNWNEFTDYVVIDKTIVEIPIEVSEKIETLENVKIKKLEIIDNSKIQQVVFFPLEDINNRKLGYVIALKDISDNTRQTQENIRLTILFTIGIGMSLLGFFYVFLGRVEKNIKTTQAQLIQTEKMSSLGQLVAGIAHEINNPIGFIGGNINAAREHLQDLLVGLSFYQEHSSLPDEIAEEIENLDLEFVGEDFPKLIASMQSGCDRIRNISTSLRTFSRTDTDKKTEFNLHEGLDSTLLILKYRLKANEQRPAIEIVKNYGDIPEVKCYPGQINQVFMNLLANAIDALDESNKGKTFEEIEKALNRITIITKFNEKKKNAIVKITDNGSGIPEEVKTRIFEQGFTTKEVGKGTGLGMAIAHQIITEKHGGTIICTSEQGQGTTFTITLPLEA